jgi:hypothetical protein
VTGSRIGVLSVFIAGGSSTGQVKMIHSWTDRTSLSITIRPE